MALSDLLKQPDKFQSTQLKDTSNRGLSRLLREQFPATKTTSAKLETSAGLLETAQTKGLSEQAQDILKSKGEQPKQIYSGGFISDVFDTLNALQYGVVGTLQGKGFLEGVKTRASFSEQDSLGKYGVLGTIGGIALDIAVDPLTYIAPTTIISKVGKAKKVASAAKTAAELAKESKAGQVLGKTLVYRFGQDPIYKEIAERVTRNTAIGNQNLLDLARPLTKLDPEAQRLVTQARRAGNLESLPQTILEKAKPAFDELDRLGKEAVEAGLLKAETYQEHVGSYIARLYRKHEIPEGAAEKIKTIFEKKPLRIDLSRFKKRTDIPEDVREAMGEILESGYPTAKSLVQLNTAIEKAKFFKEVATKWGADEAAEGLAKLTDTKSLGALAGKFVPSAIADDINEVARIGVSDANRLLKQAVAGFKFGKVILNPATHARNVMSNFILNHFEGLNPARVDVYTKAAKELATKGELYQEARKVGLGLDTFASREIKDILLQGEGKTLSGTMKQAAEKVANIYEKEEQFAKMAQYIFQRGKGLTPEEAWKVAERATFNYAQVTPFVRKLRESVFGLPFITFTYKVTPQVAKTLYQAPTRISNIGKIKSAVENMSDLKETERERAAEPQWIRDGFYMKLPMKDSYGRSAYLDLTYILPFGDLIGGNLFQQDIKRETGLKEGLPEAIISKFPLLNVVRELGRNQDFYGNKIWRESDSTGKQLSDITQYLVKTIAPYAPPALTEQIPSGYQASGEKRKGTIARTLEQLSKKEAGEETYGGYQGRTPLQELLRQLGLKVAPMDVEKQEQFHESEVRRALETLLKEKGGLKEFTRVYQPKNK